MGNPLQHATSLPDHATDVGDRVAARIVITVHASGAMSVSGNIEDQQWALVALEHAADAVRSHHARKAGELVIPAKDVRLP